jgi:hypothetical protein
MVPNQLAGIQPSLPSVYFWSANTYRAYFLDDSLAEIQNHPLPP